MEKNSVPNPENVIELIKQMEGVENNAFTMRLLAKIHSDITAAHPASAENFVVTIKVLEEVHAQAWKNLEEMQKLPPEEQHYLYNGEISAQDAFIKIVIAAFEDDTLDDTRRALFIQEKAEAHALEAEASIAGPMGELKEVVEMIKATMEIGDTEGNTTIH